MGDKIGGTHCLNGDCDIRKTSGGGAVILGVTSESSSATSVRFRDGSSNCCSIRPSGDSVRRRSDGDRPLSRDRASGVDDDTGVGGKMIVVISSSI